MPLIPHSSPTSKANWRHGGLFLQVNCTERIDTGHMLGVCSGQDQEESLKVRGWEHSRAFPSFEEWFSDHCEHWIVFVSYGERRLNPSWFLCRLESEPVFIAPRVQLSHLIFKVTTIPPGRIDLLEISLNYSNSFYASFYSSVLVSVDYPTNFDVFCSTGLLANISHNISDLHPYLPFEFHSKSQVWHNHI